MRKYRSDEGSEAGALQQTHGDPELQIAQKNSLKRLIGKSTKVIVDEDESKGVYRGAHSCAGTLISTAWHLSGGNATVRRGDETAKIVKTLEYDVIVEVSS